MFSLLIQKSSFQRKLRFDSVSLPQRPGGVLPLDSIVRAPLIKWVVAPSFPVSQISLQSTGILVMWCCVCRDAGGGVYFPSSREGRTLSELRAPL